MSFLGANNLRILLEGTDVIKPFYAQNIKNGAYELCLGEQVFQTDTNPKAVKTLAERQEIYIQPGQFALLLTEEVVKIPQHKIAFISIKAGIKFKGLVNVSGFHVDPGFEGKLLFSVYNAGPAVIVLSRGTKYFPIWFADLDEKQNYKGAHEMQMRIPNEPVEALSQGELTSPNVLSRRIEDVRQIKTKIEWAVLAVLTLVIALGVKFWTDASKLKEAVDFGYKKKTEELKADSASKSYQYNLKTLNDRIDSLKGAMKIQSAQKDEHS